MSGVPSQPAHGRTRNAWTVRRMLKWASLAILCLFASLVVAGLIVANSQDGSVKLLQWVLYRQMGGTANSFTPPEPSRDRVRANGVRVKTNLVYGTRYPNSFLDIWYPDADLGVKRPTVIFIHGGGFFMGSKDWGDPFADGGKAGALNGTVETMARRGFNVVNMDYALAPAYRYPTPLAQMNEAIGYLTANADRLGLDMSRVFLMGGSAGAQMSAQYGVLLSDPAYAAAVGVKPLISAERVKGLILFSPPLKVSGFGWRFNTMFWAYLNTKNLESSKPARELDIVPRVNARYPATYITDGNQSDTFPAHAKALAKALQAKQVDHVFNYYEPSVARLDHGYTARLDTKWGRENLDRAIAFMAERAKPAATS